MPTLDRAPRARGPIRLALGFLLSLGLHLFVAALLSEERSPPSRPRPERSLVILPRFEVLRSRPSAAIPRVRPNAVSVPTTSLPPEVVQTVAALIDSVPSEAASGNGAIGTGSEGTGGFGTGNDGMGGAGGSEGAGTEEPRELQAVHVVPADYPREARRQKAKGVVWVRLRVDAEGRVLEAEIESSDTIEALEQAAMAAARRWRFRWAAPSETSTVLTRVPFRFELPK